MKNKRLLFPLFSFYECENIEKYLEKKASQGWMLESISFGWKFKRIDPTALHFSVNYFPKASEFDSCISDDQLRYIDYCEHGGWNLCAQTAQMKIFYTANENPVPVETDPILEVENIHNTIKRGYLPVWIMWVIISVLNIFTNTMKIFSDGSEYLPRFTNALFLVFYILLLIFWGQQLFRYAFWHKRAKKEAKDYGILYTPRDDIAFKITILTLIFSIFAVWVWSIFDKFTGIFIAVTFLDVAVIIGVVYGIKALMQKIGAPANVNKIVTIVASAIISLITISLTTIITIIIMGIMA